MTLEMTGIKNVSQSNGGAFVGGSVIGALGGLIGLAAILLISAAKVWRHS